MGLRLNKRQVDVYMALRGITSYKELSERTGVDQDTLTRVINKGGRFSVATLERLAEALECSPLDLLVAEGYPSPHLGAPAVAMIAQETA